MLIITKSLLYAILVGLGYLNSILIYQSAGGYGFVDGVIVDGKRKGPSAMVNQSHEQEMIDGYNTKTCGIADPDMKKSDFVNNAHEGQFPWLVSFQIKKPDGSRNHFCMGSFISSRWILSAAHCFADP